MPEATSRRVGRLHDIIVHGLPAWTSHLVDLGPLQFTLTTNVPEFSGLRYFSSVTRVPREAGVADIANAASSAHAVCCIDLDHPHHLDEAWLRAQADTSYRAARFKAGFYLGVNFGEPVTLITRGTTCYLVGRRLDRVVWGWYVKHLLEVYALSSGSLHLKAGCVRVGDRGVLLVGRNNGGKTVCLMQLCLDSGVFVSNTHTVVDGHHVAHGVATTLRVRNDACFGPVIRTQGLQPHLAADAGEYVLDPARLHIASACTAAIRTIFVLDHRPNRPPRIERLPARDAATLVEQFALPMNVYGMKDDVLAWCDQDLARFARTYRHMRRRLRDLIDACPCYRLSVDMLDAACRRDVRQVIEM